MDINSLISQYLSNNKEADLSTIKSALDNLKNGTYSAASSHVSVFSMNDGDKITQEDFLDAMCKTTGKSAKEIEDDVDLLFAILDNEENTEGYLSKDELELFLNGDGKADSFEVWDKLFMDEKKITTSSTTSSTEETTTSTTTSGTDKTTTETGDDTPTSSTPTTGNKTYDFSKTEDAKAFLDVFIDEENKTYADVINYLLKNGAISQEEADILTASLKKGSYTTAQQNQIDALVAKGMTEEDAIEFLEKQGKLSSTEDSTILNEDRYKNETINYEAYADDLWYAMKGKVGTNEDMIRNILDDTSITDEDFAKIVEEFQKKHPDKGLVTYLMNETSIGTQDEFCEKLAKRLVAAANNGDETAINVLAREMYSGGAERLGTADEFFDAFFASIKDEALYKVNNAYENKYSGRSFTKDIDDEYGFTSSKDEKYVAQIKAAIRKCS